jgi:hypothetical protein
MEDKADARILSKIRSSEYYESLLEDLQSKYDRVEESSSYIYRPNSFSSSEFLVIVKFKSITGSMTMDLIFKMDNDNKILDAEASIDQYSGNREPKKVDEYIEKNQSIKEKVKSMRGEGN